MYFRFGALIALSFFSLNVKAQQFIHDTLVTSPTELPDITVVGQHNKSDYQQMPEIVGTTIYAGKKSSLVVVGNVKGNVANNNMRQVLAKVPGIHIWESDPSAIQIGIAARGLSPNRSWEFNIRQNGYDIAADPFGYPEAYYNPQLQAVQRIEIVRGQGALQYGPQFGGLVNYILKNGSDLTKTIHWESAETIGSNGSLNFFNAIGGKKNKIHYYAFYDRRSGDGWRANSKYFTNSGFSTITFHPNDKLSLTAEMMVSHINSQQPGGLTDAQFKEDARQSIRSRNWMDIRWTTPALLINYDLNKHTKIRTKIFATIGDRNSVGFIASALVADTINANTQKYNARTLNADRYRNYGMESRFITNYQTRHINHTLSGGVRIYTGTTNRKANGKGSELSAYDMNTDTGFPQELDFGSQNAAFFLEDLIRLKERWIIVPGIRAEWLRGIASGRNGLDGTGLPVNIQDISKSRTFFLAGIGAEYHLQQNPVEFYANISQAYRPIQFANLQAPPGTDVVDPNLRDASGYNADFGCRGSYHQFLKFDISIYWLQYNNRIGTIIPAGQSYRLITNVGRSSSKGIEAFTECNLMKAFGNNDYEFSIFQSYSFTHATYGSNHLLADISGKRVENAPRHILRTGFSAGYKKALLTMQYQFVDETFSDANNTVAPAANGQSGLITSYHVADLTISYEFKNKIQAKAGINNLFDERYFTRRAGGYPGPGILPADGRTLFFNINFKL
jgi:Fe(3+) dicitrate transport protein